MSYDERNDLLTAYAATSAALHALMDGAGAGAADHSPADGGWSIRHVIDHFARAAEGTAKRLRHMVTEDRPDLVPFDDADDDPMPIDEAMRRFDAARAQELAVLGAADDAGWDRIGVHPAHGPISIRDIVRHMSAHDLEHIGQIGRLLAG